MALAFGPNSSGPVAVEAVSPPWQTGECIRLIIANNNNYLSAAEAVSLHEQLGAALEAVGCTPVEIAVSDESEEGSPQ